MASFASRVLTATGIAALVVLGGLAVSFLFDVLLLVLRAVLLAVLLNGLAVAVAERSPLAHG